MRIEEFHIDGFGQFEKLTVSGLGAGLSVVLGRNEAGKSTLLAFLRAVLFGLPSRKQAQHYPPLSGGRHGGRIVLVGGGAERIVVERYAGKGTGKFTARFQDGSQVGEEQFRQRLGMVTGDVYEKIFAFGLGELQTFETLQDENIRDAIYSAGMGTGKHSPAQAVRRLNDHCERMFKPGGSNPELNQILKQLLQRRKEIDSHAVDVEEHEKILANLKRAERESEEFSEALHRGRQRLARLHTLQQARDDWILLTETRQRLASLPRIESFPQEGVSRLESLLNDQRSLRDRFREVSDEKQEAEEELETIQIDERLLSLSSEIRGLERRVDLFEQNRQNLTTIQTDLRLAEQQFQQNMGDLGEEWDKDKLRNFDLSIPAREELDAARQLCEEARNRVEKQTREVELRDQELRERQESEQNERDTLDHLSGPASELDAEGIRGLERNQTTYEAARRDLPFVRQDCEGNEQRLHETLRSINPDWTEERLDQFDDSLSAREELNVHSERLADLRTRLGQLDTRIEESQQALRDHQTALERDVAALEHLPSVNGPDEAALLERKSRLRGLGSLVAQCIQIRTELAHQEERKQDLEAQLSRLEQDVEQAEAGLPAWLVPGIAFLGLLGLLVLGLARNDWVMGTVLFVVAVVIAGLLFFHQRKSFSTSSGGKDRRASERQQIRERIAAVEGKLQDIRQHERDQSKRFDQQAKEVGLANASANSSHGRNGGIRFVDEQEELIEKQLSLLRQRRPIEQRIHDGRCQLGRAQATLTEAQESRSTLQAQLQEAQADWRKWLRNGELPETLSPEVAINVLSRLDSARELLRAVNDQRRRIRDMQDEIDRFEESVRKVAADIGIEDVPTDPIAAVQMLSSRLRESDEHQRNLQQARRRVNEAKQRTTLADERLREAERLLATERDAQQEAERQWRELLLRRGLRETLNGAHAEQMMQGIGRARGQLTHLDKLQGAERDLSEQVSAFIEEVGKVESRLEAETLSDEGALIQCSTLNSEPFTPTPQRSAPDAVSACVETLVSRLRQAEEADRRRKLLLEQIQSTDEHSRQFETRVEARQQEIDQLFEAGGTTDEESFRQQASDYETYQKLTNDLRSVETRLYQLAGSADALPALERELEVSSPEEVQTEQLELREKITDLEHRKESSVRESEKLRLQLEELENSDAISTLRMQQESDLAEFRSLAEEWALHRIAAHLIDRAREKYERERRPAVVKQAEQFFRRFTHNRYREVLIAGEGDPQVVTQEGTRKQLSHLSRGTAEQLYLSLRFGFVQEFMQRAHPLPLIFDDILVNFDPERAAAAAEAIGELSRDQQVLLFTCHPTTVQLLQDRGGPVAVFELKDGRLRAICGNAVRSRAFNQEGGTTGEE